MRDWVNLRVGRLAEDYLRSLRGSRVKHNVEPPVSDVTARLLLFLPHADVSFQLPVKVLHELF